MSVKYVYGPKVPIKHEKQHIIEVLKYNNIVFWQLQTVYVK